MKTVVIPAQITTVEDKIAGNFNLTQIMLLMAPVFWAVLVYTVFPPHLKLELYKLPLIFLVTLICVALSIRIKEKVVLSWVLILLTYNLRPKFYLLDKNDSYLRTLDIPTLEKTKSAIVKKEASQKAISKDAFSFSIKDLVRMETLLSSPSSTFSLRSQKKGGLRVVFEQAGK
jgi:hypothetical protein